MNIRKIILVLLATMLMLINGHTFAATNSTNISLYSEAAILIDSNTGKILYEKNAYDRKYPASTTKVLTAIIALEKCSLDEKVKASYSAVMSIPVGYSNAAIQVGEELTVNELLQLFLIHSANEVGYILAEHISGSIDEFSKLMNEKAAEIGCTNSNFLNPSGIHNSDHYSTAYDLALITRYCMKNETFRNIVSQKSCRIAATEKYEERYFPNTNDLIITNSRYNYEYAIGVKTGYTAQAKNCLISASSKDGLELISVILGATQTETGLSARYVDTINLFNYGYDNYSISPIALKDTVIEKITVENGTKDTKDLELILENDVNALMSNTIDKSTIEYTTNIFSDISAPISQGDVLGTITYTVLDNEYTCNLIASHSVEEFKITYTITIIFIVVLFVLLLLILSNPKKKRKTKMY